MTRFVVQLTLDIDEAAWTDLYGDFDDKPYGIEQDVADFAQDVCTQRLDEWALMAALPDSPATGVRVDIDSAWRSTEGADA